MKINTVLGRIGAEQLGITLCHEHICCYSEYLYNMAGKDYLNKEKLKQIAVKYLSELKSKYGLSTFVDCTPVNIGRDVALLKEVSEKSGVNIICSTGFYYTEEAVLFSASSDLLAEYIIKDARNNNAGVIKCAVEGVEISDFNEKILISSAKAQLALGIPIVLHTNAENKNGLRALEILLLQGVKPQAITIGHLSDTENLEYIMQMLKYGCFIGLDRLYDDVSEEYIDRKINVINKLCEYGYENKILLSHDASFFNGFESNPAINESPRFPYCFDSILPRLAKDMSEQIIIKNPVKMLKCGD